MTYNSAGVLWDEELRAVIDPFAVNIIDGAHSLLCNGLAQRELSALFRALMADGRASAKRDRSWMQIGARVKHSVAHTAEANILVVSTMPAKLISRRTKSSPAVRLKISFVCPRCASG